MLQVIMKNSDQHYGYQKKILKNHVQQYLFNTILPIHVNAGIMEVASKKYLPDNRRTSDVLLQSLSVSFPVVSFNYHKKNVLSMAI